MTPATLELAAAPDPASHIPEAMAPKLLVIDDDATTLKLIERFAVGRGFAVTTQTSGHDALSQLERLKPDLALVDLKMPDVNGLDMLQTIREIQPNCHVVLMTGAGSIDTAIEAVKLGALDYLTKPFDFDRLHEILTTVRMDRERRHRFMRADEEMAKRFEFHRLIGRSPAMQQLFDMLRRVGPHARTVLVTGETGTGKELVARALHQLGPRRTRPLVTLNCSAVVDTLCESELFGHVRGAFTGATQHKDGLFEVADGATLFLDEVGELSLSTQAKLLRAIEHGEIQRVGAVTSRRCDVHIIAATNRDLEVEVAAGRFRRDLFYRLSVLDIHLPPLRDRREDISYLAASFLREFGSRVGRPVMGVTAAAERLLQQAPWPGNVRELRNVVERVCMVSDGGILSDRDLRNAMSGNTTRPDAGSGSLRTLPGPQAPDSRLLATTHRAHIERILREAHGNKTAAAHMLGISRRSLYRWLDRLQLAS